MKKAYAFISAVVFFLLAVGCSKEQSASIPMAGDYLPMQAGNYWELEHTSKISITSTRDIDNKTYFAFVQATDTTYYRSEYGKIYARHLTGNESVIFDLTANVNESWTYNSGAEWTVKMVSKTDTILINHTKVPNCYHFFFDIPGVADDEHGIWLAPGIGFIKLDCGFCPYPFLNLQKASINKEDITFP